LAIAQYKCPNCGKILVFRADKQGWFCECCESLFNDEEIKIRFDFNKNGKYRLPEKHLKDTDIKFSEKARLSVCSKCGNEFVSDVSSPVEECVFCHNKIDSYERISGDYCPYSTLKFSISEDEAVSSFNKFCGKRKFMPSGYKKNFSIKPVYIPFQVADCIVKADADAEGRKINSSKDKKFRYTRTKEFSIKRNCIITFDGIPADNFSGLSRETLDSIEPFDFNKMVIFDAEHIKDIPVNCPDSNKKQPFQNVKNRCVVMSDNIIRQSMKGYSSLAVPEINVNIMDTNWRYILLPVWLYTFSYHGKQYEFAVNGQNGKYSGTLPLSLFKMLSACIGAGLLASIIFITGGLVLR
jgi:DNA-directed RNA polymerase subunit M/transcription elongation factor TFIIS